MRPATLSLLFVAACAQVPADVRAPPATEAAQDEPAPVTAPEPAFMTGTYMMRGPRREGMGNDWRAVITPNRMLLASPTSAGWYVEPRPPVRVEQDRQVFRTERMTVAIEPGACALARHRDLLPDRVSLDWDGGSFEGCGGPRPGPAGIADTVWELVRVGHQIPPPDRSPAATLGFAADGGVGGTQVCNNVGSNLRWRPDGSFARIPDRPGFASTLIGCYGPGHAISQRFWEMMARATSWRRDGERLFIADSRGETAELRFLLGL